MIRGATSNVFLVDVPVKKWLDTRVKRYLSDCRTQLAWPSDLNLVAAFVSVSMLWTNLNNPDRND
jgi:hypothetical protein